MTPQKEVFVNDMTDHRNGIQLIKVDPSKTFICAFCQSVYNLQIAKLNNDTDSIKNCSEISSKD